MQNLFYIVFVVIIHFITNTENFIIRVENSNTKRVTKDTKSNQYAVTSQNNQQFTNVERKDSEDSIEDTSDDMSSHPHYKFSYKVFNPETGDDKEHREERDGELVQGEYSLIEPDGSRRIVTYISNGTDGFKAIIKKLKPTNAEKFVQEINTEEEATTSPQQIIKSYQGNETDSKTFKNENSNVEIHSNKSNIQKELSSEITNTETLPKPDINDDDQVLWFSSKTEYLSPDSPRQANDEEPQLMAEESQNQNVVVKSKNSPTHFITYSLLIPQIPIVSANTDEGNVSQNFDTNSKKNRKSQKTTNKNLQIQSKVQRQQSNKKTSR